MEEVLEALEALEAENRSYSMVEQEESSLSSYYAEQIDAFRDEVARQLGEVARPLSVRVASFRRDVCRAARDLELDAMLLVLEASADDLAFARDEGLAAVGAAPGTLRAAVRGVAPSCDRKPGHVGVQAAAAGRS